MTSAPLPLLGTFHEVSIAVPDVREAVEFYERLGFTQATTTDAFSHPYGVLTDGRLFIGLHQRPGPSPVLTFVRPGIAASLGAFAAAGIHLTTCHVGDEVFNEIAFADPSGQTVAVLEARTYSPVARAVTDASLCGDFAELSLPAGDFAAAREFWEPLGFVAAEELPAPYPHLPLISDRLDLAFHPPAFSTRPLLVFHDSAMRARIERLRELGVPVGSAPATTAGNAVSGLLASPDGTALLLLEQDP
jgi:catechol 2,3-dioxygenase-like lactoylglutathione lyase family enzyme